MIKFSFLLPTRGRVEQLNAEALSELGAYSRDDLIAHGFEFLFRVP